MVSKCVEKFDTLGSFIFISERFRYDHDLSLIFEVIVQIILCGLEYSIFEAYCADKIDDKRRYLLSAEKQIVERR